MAQISSNQPTINFGKYSLLAIGLQLFVNLSVPVWYGGDFDNHAFFLGLCFGQASSVVMWLYACRSTTWQRLTLCYVVVLAVGGMFILVQWYSADYERNFSESATILTAFLIPSSVSIVILLAGRFIWCFFAPTSNSDSITPRFRVGHLVGATTALACLSLLIRIAMPDIGTILNFTTLILFAEAVLLCVIASYLAASQRALFWKWGLLAAAGVAGTLLESIALGWQYPAALNATQVSTLAVFMSAFHIDEIHQLPDAEPNDETAIPLNEQETDDAGF